jgi:penicillin V acylase-like amidase (Ntn superfamily)
MCKVTINGKTYLGSNEDSWQVGSRITFVNAPPGKLGALYVSYKDFFAQGGMNEAGLAFDGLTIYKANIKVDSLKKNVTNFRVFIRDIMQNCKTVEDVRKYASQYNRHGIR